MENLGKALGLFLQQVIAFVIPGLAFVMSVGWTILGPATWMSVQRDLQLPGLVLLYGLSLASGFAFHMIAIFLLFKQKGQSMSGYGEWVSRQHGPFHQYANPEERILHGSFLGYWQLCSNTVIAAIFVSAALSSSLLPEGPRRVVLISLCALILLALLGGHYFMKHLVEGFERRVAERDNSRPPV